MAGSTLPELSRAAYAHALQSVLHAAPGADPVARTADLDAFFASGFPSTKLEDWRYTDLTDLAATGFAVAANSPVPAMASRFIDGTCRLVFVNGHFLAAASDFDPEFVSRLPARRAATAELEPVTRLNSALATDGAVLRLAPGRNLDRPLHVLSLTVPGSAPSMAHLCHRIELAEGAGATVVFEDMTFGSGSHFLTQRCEVHLAGNARLELIRAQDHGPGVQALTRWDATLARDAVLDWVNLDLGGARVRNDLCVNLAQANAGVNLSGVFIADGESHIDNYTRIEHRSTHGTSRQAYRGIAADRGKGIFRGKVAVHPNAHISCARLHVDPESNNLLFSKLVVKSHQMQSKRARFPIGSLPFDRFLLRHKP